MTTNGFFPRTYVGPPAEASVQFCEVCHESTYKQQLKHIGIGKRWDQTQGITVPERTVKVCPPCEHEIREQVIAMRNKVIMLQKVQRLVRENAPMWEIDAVVEGYGLDSVQATRLATLDPTDAMFQAWLEG